VGVNFTAFRIFKVARLLRLLKTSENLQMLLYTLYQAMGNIFNVLLLFALQLFVFAIAGMNLFGDLSLDPDTQINSDVNFKTFYSSCMVLFRASTGESWNAIMHDQIRQNKTNKSYDKLIMTQVFWLLYTFVGFFIYVNVLIAVIFYEYEKAYE